MTGAQGVRLGLFGASGRMGRKVQEALAGPFAGRLALAVAVDADTPAGVGFAGCDVVVDFSVAAATDDLLARLSGLPDTGDLDLLTEAFHLPGPEAVELPAGWP